MQAIYEIRKPPDRLAVAVLSMAAALVIGGIGGYTIKGLTEAQGRSVTGGSVSAVGKAVPASDPRFQKRLLKVELQDQQAQAGPEATVSNSHRRHVTQQ